MKIIGIAASARKNKSTRFVLEQCLKEARRTAEGAGLSITVELVELAGLNVNGCLACDACKKGVLCSQQDDYQPLIAKLADPDVVGIILATPVYMGSMSSQAKAFLDRTVIFRRNGFMFRNKLGGAIAVGGSRNGGQELTIQAVHAAMMIHDMIIVGDGDHFGGIAWGNHPDGYQGDMVGIATARNLGCRMAEVARMMRAG
ncbi:MAG: flavodoxin family protein [Desulfobulbaceae bacterium]|nr:flavodoxin family protein [Desulfobulbaceae bacterium]